MTSVIPVLLGQHGGSWLINIQCALVNYSFHGDYYYFAGNIYTNRKVSFLWYKKKTPPYISVCPKAQWRRNLANSSAMLWCFDLDSRLCSLCHCFWLNTSYRLCLYCWYVWALQCLINGKCIFFYIQSLKWLRGWIRGWSQIWACHYQSDQCPMFTWGLCAFINWIYDIGI